MSEHSLPLEYNPMSRTGIIGERPSRPARRIVVATGGRAISLLWRTS